MEGIRPEIQQYLIEPEDVEAPFSRQMRNTVYQRAKMKVGTVSLTERSHFTSLVRVKGYLSAR